MKITIADVVLVALVLILSVGSFFSLPTVLGRGSTVFVEMKGMMMYKGDLAENRKVTVRGAHGDVRIQIKDGKVGVLFAECPNKICVRTGWRSRSGESIICVPNAVLIRIEGESNVVRGVTG
jgi:hypothetical protein